MTAEIKDDAPIPPEINKYLAILSKDPGSMVFAPLAEAYRKAGMLDEAIATARDGLKLRPDYVSGMVALGRAYFEKGLLAEARENLEKVLIIAPDNIIAAGILEEIKSKWSVVRGQGPEKPEPVTPDLEPDKAVSQESEVGSQKIDEPEIEELTELEEFIELEEVDAEEKSGDFQVEEISFEAPEPGLGLAKEVKETEEEKTAEDIGIWGEEAASELEAEPAISEVIEPEAQLRSPEVEEKEARSRKEITTETIADLYIKQGYFDKAIDIYQTLYDADPGNDDIKRKLDELKKQLSGVSDQGAEVKRPEEELVVRWAESTGQGAELKTDENIDRLGSWLKTIQSERRKG
ncbi:MAG: tetratricopeptide repeat protein [Deltaproteobacteria bacterium]